jgi:pimeloyl-ACP methyl ester carboxylesterase
LKPLAGFLSANGALLYYEVEGDGPPLVLLHGWSLDLRMFDLQMTALTHDYGVIRMDRRGFGRSSDAEDMTWNAADLNALLDHLGVARAHVLGMSQGGRVALDFTAAFPDRVDRLILQGSMPPSGFGLRWSGPDRFPVDEYRALARTHGLDGFRGAWAAHPLMRLPAGAHERDARRLVETMLADYRGGLLLQPVDSSGPFKGASFAEVRAFQAPALVLTGDQEIRYLQITADALAYALPHARRVVLPGGGHLINLSEPERYSEAVLEFLGSAA